MYNSGPLWVHFKNDGGQRGRTAVGLPVLWVHQEGGGAQGGAQGYHYHIGEDVHV